MVTTIILIAFFTAAVTVAGLRNSGVPRAFHERCCQGAQWRRQFPNASKKSIRQFLALFASAFAIKAKHALRFSPNDELLAIYRARYPSRLTPDALEFETLDLKLQKHHGLALASIWHEHFTLGELFGAVSAAEQSARADGKTAAQFRRG
ncbi:MAG: hypothetical protein AB1832_09615 [Pseudomonadota bacterium]